ncbi:hypothetical protein Cme02nite_53770 [Catellatospora methionotrophica]|uniref:Uncharacterized protein n=1 Tax=Catellatospora methionotrophica TaxID=121620 RepID=A0A8J3LES4_9ACTN|nr:DUF6518 family protein [Catellatospora methionotrophica]GIG17045.1 hypothetical protein Cme02nite_53770 [Catellatospora methionotrophica]
MATVETPPAGIDPPGVVRRPLRWVPVAGALLGTLAFLGDELPGLAGQLVLMLTSNGFAWGAAALVTGHLVRQARRAPLVATVVLLVATAMYYLLILFVSRRWSGGQLEDGSSADTYALFSLARAAGFWALLAIGAGLVLGLLGHAVRNGSPRTSAAAAGAAFGLLAGEGLYGLFTMAWTMIGDSFVQAYVISYAAQVCLAMAVVTVLTARRDAPVSWPVYTASALSAAALGATFWSVLQAIRSTGF